MWSRLFLVADTMKNKIEINVDEKTAKLLAACAAFDDATPEEFARAAIESSLVGTLELMATQIKK